MRKALIACLLLAAGCASLQPIALKKPAAENDAAVLQAADEFYAAKDVGQLKAAVAKALQLSPESAISNELAAQYARLQGNERAEVSHLITALQDSSDADALLH